MSAHLDGLRVRGHQPSGDREGLASGSSEGGRVSVTDGPLLSRRTRRVPLPAVVPGARTQQPDLATNRLGDAASGHAPAPWS